MGHGLTQTAHTDFSLTALAGDKRIRGKSPSLFEKLAARRAKAVLKENEL